MVAGGELELELELGLKGDDRCDAVLIIKGENFRCTGSSGHQGWPHGSIEAGAVWCGSGVSDPRLLPDGKPVGDEIPTVMGHCAHCVNFGRWCTPTAPDWWHRNEHGAWPDGHCPDCTLNERIERIVSTLEDQALAYALEVGCSRELLDTVWRVRADEVDWLQRASVLMQAADIVRSET